MSTDFVCVSNEINGIFLQLNLHVSIDSPVKLSAHSVCLRMKMAMRMSWCMYTPWQAIFVSIFLALFLV